MSELDLNNIVGFKAIDADGNEQQVTVDEMVGLVSARIVSAASEISTFEAAAEAGTDEFEDQLTVSDTFSWLRTMDGSKNPTLTSSTAAAKVLGGLIGINKTIKQFNPLSDLNDINGVGFSGYGLSVMNTPTGRYGTVFQLSNKAEAISGEAGSWLYQFCFETESNRILYRKRINDIDWGDWFEIVLKSI